MSKTSKTTQLKTKSRLSTETVAKKSTTAIPTAVTTTAKLTTKPKSIRNATATTTTNLGTPTKPEPPKEATDAKIISTRETKDNKLTPRKLTKTESNVGTRSKQNETTAIKSKTVADRSSPNRTQTTRTTAATATKKVASTASKIITSKSIDQRIQPLRAKHTDAIVKTVRKNTANLTASKSSSKPNPVLDTYHNVTVASPPQQRKDRPVAKLSGDSPKHPAEINTRPRTRTLDNDEVLILKSESARLRSEKEVLQNAEVEQQPKEPIAFEVKFEEQERPSRERSRSRPKATTNNTQRENDEYADDFESYESDFETGSSSQTGSGTESAESSSGSSSITSENESESDAESGLSSENAKVLRAGHEINEEEDEEDADESELTQFPITVIHRDKERERKLDSGNYEMPMRSYQKRLAELSQNSSQPMFEDSLDTFSAGASEQLDSGISSYGNATRSNSGLPTDAVTYGGYANFNTHPAMTPRGLELMSKIKFDTLTFTLLDLKPITYDVFMQTFGKLNTTQCSTQTQDQRTSLECQTDDYETRSIWTQHPPQYDLSTMQKLSGVGSVQNSCGELPINDLDYSSKPRDQYEASLQALSVLRAHEDTRTVKQQLRRLHKPVDCERLNQFLLRSALLISRILNANNGESKATQNRQLAGSNSALSAISAGYRQLDAHFLNALHVVRIFANAQHNLVLTVHTCRPDADVYRSDFSNLLMVWSASDANAKPLRLLSTWSEVCRAEICVECADIVVCGLRDGSVALWDLRETHSFCSKLDGHLTHFAATQSIVPSLEEASARKFTDLGAAVDVKSFRAAPKILGLANAVAGYKTLQFASLHDTGILTVWTLVETGKQDKTLENLSNMPRRGTYATPAKASCEYSSPWARVKLMQSAICDLRDYLEHGIQKARSKFDKTKSLFQHNIYSDQVLRELNETQSELKNNQELQGLRFTSIDAGCERVYVCTNRNFILACSKSLKTERFRKININESRFLFPTALRVLSNEEFLAVGLSNGAVMILNCNQSKNVALNSQYHDNDQSSTLASIQARSTPNQDYELETGKSCAIQNIILNERRTIDPSDFNHDYEERPSTTAACLTMINEQKKPFELRVYDQQLLLSGSVLRKNLVQSLELSRDGWKLFALSDGEIRSYDFFLDREVVDDALKERVGEDKISDIAVASSGKSEQYLLLLQANDELQLHLLKQ